MNKPSAGAVKPYRPLIAWWISFVIPVEKTTFAA